MQLVFEALARWRNAHQAAQAQPRALGNRFGQLAGLLGGNAALAALFGKLHLNAEIERRRVMRTLFVQARGDALAIDGVDPVEMLGDDARLIGLQLSREVPDQRQILQCSELGLSFLQIVLAEISYAEGGQLPDRERGLSLADRNQPHRLDRAAGVGGRSRDSLANLGQASARVRRLVLVRQSRFPREVAGVALF